MRIGFDAKRIYFNQTGLGNYSRSLVAGLSEAFPDNEYHLYTPGMPHFQNFLQGNRNVHRHLPATRLSRKFPAIWRTLELGKELQRDRIQLFHGLSNELPAGIVKSGIRTVVTIHDLIFMHYPELYPVIDRRIYRRKFEDAVNNAHLVLATSEQTRADILHFFHADPGKVVVHYQDCHPRFRHLHSALETERFRKKHHLFQPYLVSVGTIEQRKNHRQIVQAFAALKNHDLLLVILGKKGPAYPELIREIKQLGIEHRVRFPEHLADEDLPLLLQASVGSVYLSRYEGFGIPVLEALRGGVPVLTSTVSSLPEVGGEAAVICAPNQTDAVVHGMEQLLNDNRSPQQRLADASSHLFKFDSGVLSEQLMKHYNTLLQA